MIQRALDAHEPLAVDGGSRLPLSASRMVTLRGFDEPVELVAVD